MVNWLTEDEKKFVAQMKVARLNERMIALLERKLEITTKQLRQASLELVPRLQGRCLELESLIEAFT